MVDLYLSGVDSFTVGLQANCDAATVLKAVRDAGHEVRPRGGRKPNARSSLTIEAAAALYERGLSVQEVADRAGIDRATMASRLKRHGVAMRSLSEVARLKRLEGKMFGRPRKG